MLKVEHSTDYLKKGRSSSETFKGAQHVKQITSQRKTLRFKRSDDNPELPENFKVGKAVGGGDCFFDSVAQGLKRLKPDMDFTVKSLREACKKFAQSQLENDQSWLKEALKNENEQINEYVPRIEFTADDIEQKSGPVNVLGLTSPVWGRIEIEGRIICKEYNVKLHVVEKHVVEGKEVWLDQIVNSKGSRPVDSIDYNEENTIHVMNGGNAHFEPILNNERQSRGEQLKKQERPNEESFKLQDSEKKSQESGQQSPDFSSDRLKRTNNDPKAGSSQQSSFDNSQSVQDNQAIDSAQHQQINPNSPDFIDSDDEREKNTELFSAIKNGNLRKVQELLKAGVKVSIIDKNNKDNTPLHYAIERDKKEIAEELLQEWKADINAKNNKGNTPLHIATSKGNKELVQLLVSNNAKTDIKNNEDRTPLDTAKYLERQDIVEILKSHIQPNLQVSVERPSTQQKRTRTDSKEDKSEDSSHKRPRTSLQAAEESRGRKRTQNEENELGADQVKKLKTSEGYPASGLKHTLHGNVYQLKLLMLFLKRGLNKSYSFLLATEMDAAEKFDDLVFKYESERKDGRVYRFLQAKHKQDESKKISVNDLLTEKDEDFSLQKYFLSYRKIKQNPEFNDQSDELKDFVICTNIDLGDDLQNSFERLEDEDDIINIKVGNNSKEPKRLKFRKGGPLTKETLTSRLVEVSDLKRLAKKLADTNIRYWENKWDAL